MALEREARSSDRIGWADGSQHGIGVEDGDLRHGLRLECAQRGA
jgi:hypothetical protein